MIPLFLSLSFAAGPPASFAAQRDDAGLYEAPTDALPAWAEAGGHTRVDGRCVPLRRTFFGQLEADRCPTGQSPCGAAFQPGRTIAAIPCGGGDPGAAWTVAEIHADRIVLQPAWSARITAPVGQETRRCTAPGPDGATATRTCPVAGEPRFEVTLFQTEVRSFWVMIPTPVDRTDQAPVNCAVPCAPLPDWPSSRDPLIRRGDPRATIFRDAAACEAATDAGELPFLAAATCLPD